MKRCFHVIISVFRANSELNFLGEWRDGVCGDLFKLELKFHDATFLFSLERLPVARCVSKEWSAFFLPLEEFILCVFVTSQLVE